MDERYDNWDLTEQEKELLNYLSTKRRLAKNRAEYLRQMEEYYTNEQELEPYYCEETQPDW